MRARGITRVVISIIALFGSAAAAFAASVVVQAWTEPKGSRLFDDNPILQTVRTKGTLDSASGAGSSGSADSPSGGSVAAGPIPPGTQSQGHETAPPPKFDKDLLPPRALPDTLLTASGPPPAAGAAGPHAGGTKGGDNTSSHNAADRDSSANHASSPSSSPSSSRSSAGDSGDFVNSPVLSLASPAYTPGYESGVYAPSGISTFSATPSGSTSPTGGTAAAPHTDPGKGPVTNASSGPPPEISGSGGNPSGSGRSASLSSSSGSISSLPPEPPSLVLPGGTSDTPGDPPPGAEDPHKRAVEVPEPAGLPLLGAGLATMLALGRRTKRRRDVA